MTGGVKMIESVYSSQAHGSTSSVLVKIPKNVRQVGQVNDAKKIYVEDYVMSYIKKLGIRKDATSELVVLLGQFVKINNCQCTFISGAIEIKNVIYEDNLVFSNEIWTNIYETIKQYFTNVEIVGWSIIRAGLPLNVDERIRKVHVDNFAGQDKTLLLYDSLEREEAFYVFEENKLKRQDGYYIFYDKNAEMQNYIITLSEEQNSRKPYSIPRRSAPPVITEMKTDSDITRKKRPALVYGLGAVAAAVVLVFSAATLNNYDKKMQGGNKSADVMSESVGKENSEAENAMSGKATDPVSLPVETAQGKLATINNDENDEESVVKTEPTTDAGSKETLKDDGKDSKAGETKKKEETSKEDQPKKEETKKQANEAAAPKSYYTVKKGESLSSISMKLYNSKSYVKKIMELNNIEDSDKIIIGQKLLLP